MNISVRRLSAALLWAFCCLAPSSFAQSTGNSENPWKNSTPARYIYLSPTGSDKNDGRTPTAQNGSGPKATLQGALSSASNGPISSKLVLVLSAGRYDLTAPVVIPDPILKNSALKIRSAENETAIITGAKAFLGSWSQDQLRPGVVKWELSSSVPVDYRSFHTLYSQRGEILLRARFPDSHWINFERQQELHNMFQDRTRPNALTIHRFPMPPSPMPFHPSIPWQERWRRILEVAP